ncbi:hypothetical protein LRS10_13415 [Phenylobacterium sp. J426]|uniref:hypothetical protein n=1 Tax=Phenylobacterium sp. J426 TaxID=2898439 RepID=UPI0021509E0E|nr:hypothetical protein [Phenylobacterium sp. J426]MCR5875093.1 hypothetical protein [Phenylobacterium sp. J426]
MSEFDTTGGAMGSGAEGSGAKAQAKAAIGQASQALKQEAQTFASAAQEKARTEAQRRTETATRTLGDFANAIRRAGDELAQADQSPAARLIGQAADGLENFSRNLAGKQPEELLDAVRDFGRRHPVAFIGGAVLAGLALGRFVRASEEMSGLSGEVGGAPYPIATTAYSGAVGSDDLEVGAAGGLASAPTTLASADLSTTMDDSLGVQGTDAEVMASDVLGDGTEDMTATDLDQLGDGLGAGPTGRPSGV